MSFWRSQGWFNSSPINKLLDNENIALTEIFDQDDILSELKTNNKKLIDYLKSTKNIDMMILFLTEESTSTEENRKYKYPWIAAEILSTDTQVVDALIENKELYEKLLNFLFSSSAKSTGNFLTNYVCKVFGFFLAKSTQTVIESFKAREHEIFNFFENIENSSVLELLLKLIACDITEHIHGISDWLLKVNMIQYFVTKLVPSSSFNSHENIAQLFTSIISLSLQVPYSPILDHVKNEKLVLQILEVLQDNENVDKENNLETYLSAMRFGFSILTDIAKLYCSGAPYDNSTPYENIPSILQELLRPSEYYNTLLLTTNQMSSEMETTFGKIKPLGSHRLQLVELLQTIFSSRYTVIYYHCLDNNVLQHIYNLFFEYPWNNLLHILVAQMTQNILDCGNEDLVVRVFESTRLHVELANAGISSVDKESKRPGLMGIVTKIATALQNVNYPSLRSILEESVEWGAYINGDFQETKKKENTPIGKSSQSEVDNDDQNNEEMKLFQARTKRNFEITFPDDFAVGDIDDTDLEVYFLPHDEKQFTGINTDEDGMDIFEQFV